jgi:hypothetical protein
MRFRGIQDIDTIFFIVSIKKTIRIPERFFPEKVKPTYASVEYIRARFFTSSFASSHALWILLSSENLGATINYRFLTYKIQ